MKIYYDPITVNCRKVLAGMALLGVEYETGKIDYFAGGHKEPSYTAINPNASIPALTDGDFVLWESNAILQYAADKSGPTSAYPQDPQMRADINRWHLWEASQWFPSCYVYLVENLVKPMTGGEPDESTLEAQGPTFHHLAGILEQQRLDHQPWLCGDEVTIADIAVAAPMHLHAHAKLPLDSHPHLVAWMERVEALPCWQSTDVRPLLGLS
ncbi:MAG: glutathione S-transferase family protein [Gammaproteobacteria bacterium]